jgi:hypothetical protein
MAQNSNLTITDVSGQQEPVPTLTAQFNPTEFSITSGASYAEVAVPGLRQPLLQFVRGETRTLTAELLFDGSDSYTSVVDKVSDPGISASPLNYVDLLRRYTEISSELHAPPVCNVRWGQNTDFVGVVTSLQERFVLFAEDGSILRARVSVTIKSYVPAGSQARVSDTQSPDRFKTRVVKTGDRLDRIAADEYGDPTLWRNIALYNDIARPRLLKAGTVLQIPPL